jgi:integrase
MTKLQFEKSKRIVGKHSDGAGLYLVIHKPGSGSWVFRYSMACRVRDYCIGSLEAFPDIDDVRELHIDLRRQVKRGVDVLEARGGAYAHRKQGAPIQRNEERSTFPTFEAAAMRYLDNMRADWVKGMYEEHLSRLQRFVFPIIGKYPVDSITVADVVRVLSPIWTGNASNRGKKTQGLIDAVLCNVITPKRLVQPTVAAWESLKGQGLKAKAKASKQHASIPVEMAPEVFRRLQANGSTAARALQMIMLSGCREGEVVRTDSNVGAQFEEFDFGRNVWRIPGVDEKTGRRTKTEVERIVPLTAEMLRVIGEPGEGGVFNGGCSRSWLALLVKQVYPEGDVTVHGLRSTLKNFLGSRGVRKDIKELCIGHSRKGIDAHYGDVESDELGEMREAMALWDDYLAGR